MTNVKTATAHSSSVDGANQKLLHALHMRCRPP